MPPLALVVMQTESDCDPEPALAALPAARRFLLRPLGLRERPVPAAVETLETKTGDRRAAAALVARAAPGALLVVLEARERITPELAQALLIYAAHASAPRAYRARRVHRFLGRDIGGGEVVLAWSGDPDRAAGETALPGNVVRLEKDVAGMIEDLDADATRDPERLAEASVGVADLALRPAMVLIRKIVSRRRDGVPGLVLSVLESYGRLLAAAKVWEWGRRADPERSVSSWRTPRGFIPIVTRTGYVLVRADVGERVLGPLLDATPEWVDGEPLTAGGRGAAWRIAIGPDERAVLRWYRRGGALRHLVHDRYFGWRPRPIAELTTMEEARRRGVPAVEVLAVRVDRLPVGFYRGAIVTREVERAETLADVVERRLAGGERAAIISALAAALRVMHDRGVHHRDLNARNVLVCAEGGKVEVQLIDFDRAQLRLRVPPRIRQRALRRLARSLAKLESATRLVTDDDRAAFHRAYWDAS